MLKCCFFSQFETLSFLGKYCVFKLFLIANLATRRRKQNKKTFLHKNDDDFPWRMVGWWDGRMVGWSHGRMVGRSDGRANKPSMNLNCGVQGINNFQTWLFDWEFYIWKIVFPKLVFFQNRFFHRVFSNDKNKMEKHSNSNRPNESNRKIDPGNRPTEKSSAKIAWPQSAADSHEKYYKIQSSNANPLCFYSIFFINPFTLISHRRRRFFYTLQKAIGFFFHQNARCTIVWRWLRSPKPRLLTCSETHRSYMNCQCLFSSRSTIL